MRATPIRSRKRVDHKVEYAVFWAPRNSQLLQNKWNGQLFLQLKKAQRGCITKTMSAQVGSKVDYFRKQEVYELFASCIADSLPQDLPGPAAAASDSACCARQLEGSSGFQWGDSSRDGSALLPTGLPPSKPGQVVYFRVSWLLASSYAACYYVLSC